MREIEVKILRGAETGNGAYQTYIVPVDETAAVSVMNLLEEIYSKQDRTLSFFSHAACRQAACGKCKGERESQAGLQGKGGGKQGRPGTVRKESGQRPDL